VCVTCYPKISIPKFYFQLGDFNAQPHELPMTIIRDHAGLTDSWALVHPQSNASLALITDPMQAIQQLGLTVDSPLNTWSAGKKYARGILGKRLDYVLYRQPNRPEQAVPRLQATEINVAFTNHVPGQIFSFSDHFGLEVTLEVSPPTDGTSSQDSTAPASSLSDATIDTVVQTLITCYRDSSKRSGKELTVFGVSLVVLVAVAIGTAWLRHSWANPIFIVFTILLSWLSTTAFYEGFVFGNWERNALMNVIEDLEVYKKGREVLAERQE